MPPTHLPRTASRLGVIAAAAVLAIAATTSAVAQTTVTTPDAAGNVGYTPSVTLDAAGNPVIAQRDRGQDDLRVVHCDDPACAGEEAVTVPDSAGRTGLSPQIALDAAGNPIIAYFVLDDEDAPDVDEGVVVMHCDDPLCAGGGESRTLFPANTFFGFDLDMQLGPDGNPIVAWSGSSPADSRAVLLTCDDPGCTGSEAPVVLTERDAEGAVALSVTPEGRVVIAHSLGDGFFVERRTVVITCDEPRCASPQRQEIVDDTDERPSVEDLVVTPDGVPTLLFTTSLEDFGAGLAVARCPDPACSGSPGLTTLVETEEQTFLNGSLAVSPDGTSIVTYNNPTGGLVVRECATPSCGSGPTATFRGGMGYGAFPHVMTAADGGLVVAFHDSEGGTLNVLRCASTRCAAPPDPVAGAVDMSRQRFVPAPTIGGPAWAGEGAPTHDDPAAYAVLATVESFADALSGAVLAKGGPLLLTPTAALDPAVRGELDRVLGGQGTVYVLGGEAAVSSAVTDALTGDGYTVQRLAGASRFETSTAIARTARDLFGDTGTVALARAFGPEDNPTAAWADSVTGGGWAAATGTPIVLTTSDSLHPAVRDLLDADQPEIVRLLGGTAALSASLESSIDGAERTAGETRFDTARRIALDLWAQPEAGPRAYLVLDATAPTGWAFGLPAAGLAADLDAPVLAVGATTPPETATAVTGCGDQVALTAAGPVEGAVLDDLDARDASPCAS